MVHLYSPGGANVTPCLLLPTRCHNPNGISISSTIFAQLTEECRRACTANTCFLGHTWVHNSNNILKIGSASFTQLMADSPYTSQWAPLSLKSVPSQGMIWTPSNTWFLGPTWVLNTNGISIGSSVLQGSLLWQTDRPTDRPRYSVSNNRLYVCTQYCGGLKMYS